MTTASQTRKKMLATEPRKITRLTAKLICGRITVGVILVAMTALTVCLFFLAGLAGTNYWPMTP